MQHRLRNRMFMQKPQPDVAEAELKPDVSEAELKPDVA